MLEKFPQAYDFDLLEYINALEENYGETLRWWDKLLEGRTPAEKRIVYV